MIKGTAHQGHHQPPAGGHPGLALPGQRCPVPGHGPGLPDRGRELGRSRRGRRGGPAPGCEFHLRRHPVRCWWPTAGEDVSAAIRTEEGGRGASTVAAIPAVREALLDRQREFRRAPGSGGGRARYGHGGIQADAPLKFFLTASAEERAERRYKQLIAKGESVSLPRLLEDIEERDARDSGAARSLPWCPRRTPLSSTAPPRPSPQVFAQVMQEGD